MIYRVLAGIIPMILGWMIWSGAIPVRQWIFGNAVPAPEQVVRQAVEGRHALGGSDKSAMPDIQRLVREQESVMSQAVEGERMMRDLERAAEEGQEIQRRIDARRSSRASSNRPGWAPSGNWSAR